MTLEAVVTKFGYAAVFLGSAFEGETVVALGGLAAHRGYLHLPWVIACAFAGTLLADQFFFYLGRRHGQAILDRRASWRPRVARVLALLERHQYLVILGFRFAYGLRTITPFAVGLTRVRPMTFLVLNVVAAAVWATVGTIAGYVLGEALSRILGDLRRFEEVIFLLVALVGAGFWLFHFIRRRRASRR